MPTRLGAKRRSRLWRPTDVQNALAAWFDASDSSSLTFNGSNVSSWRDKSPAALHCSQATAANQPGYHRPTSTSDVAYVDFTVNVPSSLASLPISVVHPIGAEARTIIGVYTPQSTAAQNPYFAYGYGSSGQTFGIANFNGHDPYLACYAADTDSGIAYASGIRIFATATNLLNVQTISKNGGTLVSGTNTINTSNYSFYLGAAQYTAGQQCYLHEVLVFYGLLTAAQIAYVEGYVAWKWLLQGSLPKTHRFANQPPRVAL